MMSQFFQEFVVEEVALSKLQVAVQETKEAQAPSIATAEANTIAYTSMVSSPSIDLCKDRLGSFLKHTLSIGSKILRQMG